MGKELFRLPAARAALDRMRPILGHDLDRLLRDAPDAELALTLNAQRAIHASHVAHWLALKERRPELALAGAVGHSMGVVAALVAAEALSVEDSASFILARARAFSDCCKRFTEPMGLAAVSADDFRDVAESAAEVPGVSVALWNTVGRGTLGGTIAALEAYAAKAREEDWPVRVKILPVEGPYHTAAFEPALPALREAAARLRLRRPKAPVFMGTSGRAEDDPERIRGLLAEQAVALERHLEAVRAAYAAGCRRFVEASFEPQPIGWLKDQLVADDGSPLPFESEAVSTSDMLSGA